MVGGHSPRSQAGSTSIEMKSVNWVAQSAKLEISEDEVLFSFESFFNQSPHKVLTHSVFRGQL